MRHGESMLSLSKLDKVELASYADAEHFGPASENLIEGVYRELLVEGDCAIDIGVNYGRHLLPLRACVGDTGTVYGVEANPELCVAMFKRLAQQGIGNVHLLNIAAMDREGYCDFYLNRSYSGRSSRTERRHTAEDVIQRISVYGARLSTLIPPAGRPTFIKLDIEGGEFPALLGASELLTRAASVLIFEGNLHRSAEQFGHAPDEVAAYFDALGYAVCDLFGKRVDLARWRNATGWNFVAFRDDAQTAARVGDALTRSWSRLLASAKGSLTDPGLPTDAIGLARPGTAP